MSEIMQFFYIMAIQPLKSIRNIKPKTQELYARAIQTVLGGQEPTAKNITNCFFALIESQKNTNDPLSVKTLNLYRSAIKKWLSDEINFLNAMERDSQEVETILEKVSDTKINLKSEQSTPQKKIGSKKFPASTLVAIREENTKGRRNDLLWFVEANLIVGLRPTEWFSAGLCSNIVDKHLCLVVRSAKHSEERKIGNGEHRFYDIENLSPLKKAQLERYLEYIQFVFSQKNEPQKYFHQLNVVFNRIKNRRGISTRETLYSTRHQVIANLKNSSLHSPNDIASMMGHISTNTARHHYGPKVSGSYEALPLKARELKNHYEKQIEQRLVNEIRPLVGKEKQFASFKDAQTWLSNRLQTKIDVGTYFENGSMEQQAKIATLNRALSEVKAMKNIAIERDISQEWEWGI